MCLKAEIEGAETEAQEFLAGVAAQKAYVKRASTGEVKRIKERAAAYAEGTRVALERIAANMVAGYAQAELALRGEVLA